MFDFLRFLNFAIVLLFFSILLCVGLILIFLPFSSFTSRNFGFFSKNLLWKIVKILKIQFHSTERNSHIHQFNPIFLWNITASIEENIDYTYLFISLFRVARLPSYEKCFAAAYQETVHQHRVPILFKWTFFILSSLEEMI